MASAREKYYAYRRVAQRMAKKFSRDGRVLVSDTANVWPTQGGAFVEATIWVSDGQLPPKE